MLFNCQEVTATADAKRRQRFDNWLAADNVRFVDDLARQRYTFIANLFKDAVEMKKPPERVPVFPSSGHFPLEHAGITFHEAMYDVDKLIQALRKYHMDFDPDTFSGSHIGSGRVLELLDAKQYAWAGHGVSLDHEYQFLEQERMQPDEYDDLIDDPTGFHFHKFLPRVCGTLSFLERFPPLVDMRHMSSMHGALLPFDTPRAYQAFERLMKAARQASLWTAAMGLFRDEMVGLGYPPLGGGMCEAPYDIIGDSFRGTRGISLDMIRIPEKLLQACEKYVPTQIKRGKTAADASGNPFIFMPLHKGAHAFMSQAQFKTFYWPTLRNVLIGMINEGLIPFIFAESDYNSRLEIISDLPKGRTVWMFEDVDMEKAKATIGQVACIAGNLPNILFRAGTPDDVKAHCQKLIDTVGKNGGFILSTAAGMQGAKPENVKTVFEFTRTMGRYS